MVKTIENSSLLDVEEGIICHQVNCIGVMGAGVALQIRQKWPNAYNDYKDECSQFTQDPKKLLGHVQDILVKDNLVVANCYGQVFPGHGVMTDYNAWDIMLDKLRDLSIFYSLDLHFPWMVGCGLAGGDWNVMSKKINDVFGRSLVNVFIHKLK